MRENCPMQATDQPVGLRDPSKESLLLADDLDPLVLAAFDAQPPDLSPTEDFQRTSRSSKTPGSGSCFRYRSSRPRCTIGRRIGRPANDFEVRVFAGALTGAMMAAFDNAPQTAETIYRALDFVDAGMPLG